MIVWLCRNLITSPRDVFAFVCLSVKRLTQNVVDEFWWLFGGVDYQQLSRSRSWCKYGIIIKGFFSIVQYWHCWIVLKESPAALEEVCSPRILLVKIIIITRRMYWRRASIQDGQAPDDATVLKRFFCNNCVIFVVDRKEFFYVCLYANFSFSWWSRDRFSAPFWAYVCQIPGHRLSGLAKVRTFQSLGFPSVPLVWGKLFPIGCA